MFLDAKFHILEHGIISGAASHDENRHTADFLQALVDAILEEKALLQLNIDMEIWTLKVVYIQP